MPFGVDLGAEILRVTTVTPRDMPHSPGTWNSAWTTMVPPSSSFTSYLRTDGRRCCEVPVTQEVYEEYVENSS